MLSLIAAVARNGVIGKDNQLLWHLPGDMRHFRETTRGKPVIMGRKTWESLPEKFRPLPGRTNIVVTRQEGWGATPEASGAVVLDSLEEALVEAQFSPGGDEVWVIGGGQVYAQAAEHCNVAVVTVINSDVSGDTQAPGLGQDWSFRGASPLEGWHTSKNGTEYRITMWAKGDTEFQAE